jgi:predicted small secreted protein
MGLWRMLVVLVVTVPFLLAGCHNSETGAAEDGMATAKNIPLLDMNRPAVTETATFALG